MESDICGFKSQICHWLALWPWAGDPTSLGLMARLGSESSQGSKTSWGVIRCPPVRERVHSLIWGSKQPWNKGIISTIEKREAERKCNDLPKVTQLESAEAGIWTRDLLDVKSILFPLHLPIFMGTVTEAGVATWPDFLHHPPLSASSSTDATEHGGESPGHFNYFCYSQILFSLALIYSSQQNLCMKKRVERWVKSLSLS